MIFAKVRYYRKGSNMKRPVMTVKVKGKNVGTNDIIQVLQQFGLDKDLICRIEGNQPSF